MTTSPKVHYSNKRPMGHIAHLSNFGLYRNIFPVSNMHFIPICPTPPQGEIILTNLHLFYVRMLSCIIQLFWLHSSKNNIFKWPHPFLTFLWLSPLKRDWPFIGTNLNCLDQTIICTKFDWFWPAGSGKEDFKKVSVYFYYFAIISPWRGATPFF